MEGTIGSELPKRSDITDWKPEAKKEAVAAEAAPDKKRVALAKALRGMEAPVPE